MFDGGKSKEDDNEVNLSFDPLFNNDKTIKLRDSIISNIRVIIDKIIEYVFGIYKIPIGMMWQQLEEGADELEKARLFSDEDLEELVFTEKEKELFLASEEDGLEKTKIEDLEEGIFTEKELFLVSEENGLENSKTVTSNSILKSSVYEALNGVLKQADINSIKILVSQSINDGDPFKIRQYFDLQFPKMTITKEQNGRIENLNQMILGNVQSILLQKEQEQIKSGSVKGLINHFESLSKKAIQPGSAITNPKNGDRSLGNKVIDRRAG